MLGVALIGVSLTASGVAYWMRGRRRSARWNARGLCGWCADGLAADHLLIEGARVCPRCASRARWRLGIAGAGVLGASLFLGATLTMPFVRYWWSGLPVGRVALTLAAMAGVAPLALGVAAVRRMQGSNRRVITAGDALELSMAPEEGQG